MRSLASRARAGLAAAFLAAAAQSGLAVDLVRDGKPVATIVVDKATSEAAAAKERRRGFSPDDGLAAQVLVDWIRKITDATLPVAGTAPAEGSAIYVGAAAVQAGLKLDEIESPSREGLRVLADEKRILLGGQNGMATVKAACRLLEELGCRFLMDDPLGEVHPRAKTLSVGKLDITEKPGFLYRTIWGSEWTGDNLWRIWNGAGGVGMGMGHAWGGYVPKALFQQHPEYFAQRAGQRTLSDWYCTSNAEVRKVFADNVLAAIKSGVRNPSISPPDGTGYCQCPACQAQDDPKSIEPSSGRVNMTNRYVDFFDDVAKRVRAVAPDSILSFYCYADYTQAPTSGRKLAPNLCAWIAPIRYCRFHRIGHPDCPSRRQLESMLDGWGSAAAKIGYRTYNYNLAECLVPFSLLSVWKHDIPYLKKKGCVGINLESLRNWEIYGPHMYQSIRLAYTPDADADALMDDYFLRFYGPKAGPLMKQYWMGIDEAFDRLKCHSGSFYAVHMPYTPEFLARCQDLLKKAADAAREDDAFARRVAVHAEGLKNVTEYGQVRGAMNRGDFAAAKTAYDALLARNEAEYKKGYGNHYTLIYLKRFLGAHVEAGAAATAPPNKVLQVLPDTWRFFADREDAGVQKGFFQPTFDDAAWKPVATFSATLDAQGLPDEKTILWYRTTIKLPAATGKLALFFTEVDGSSTVFVNGKEVGKEPKKRAPFEIDVAGAFQAGDNLVAIRVDHSKITELFLGGIIRPVLLIQKNP